MGTIAIAQRLKDGGVIPSSFLFRCYVAFYAVDQRLKPGDYEFNNKDDIQTILAKLLEGRQQEIMITVPEGYSLRMIASLLETKGICSADEFSECLKDIDFLRRHFPGWSDLTAGEGLIFPETYKIPKGTPVKDLVSTMLRLTRHRVDCALDSAPSTDLTPYQACILASIVERETKLKEEFPLVASVFLNRIQRKMRLESCATVQYALGEHKERLTYADIRIESPYNTYIREGLPPTPISNFGVMALKAVLEPAKTDYLFFVSDAAGGHQFSKTFAEHERSRGNYYKKRLEKR